MSHLLLLLLLLLLFIYLLVNLFLRKTYCPLAFMDGLTCLKAKKVRSNHRRRSIKMVFLKISQNS